MDRPKNRHAHTGPVPGKDMNGGMVLIQGNRYLLPTLLDRLRDDAPHRQTEAPGEYAFTRTQMRAIIQRDLSFLLNTTSIEDLIDRRRYAHAASSTVNFGVPPLSGTFAVARGWDEVEKIIKRAIHDFEPRLIPGSLRVSTLNAPGAEVRYNVLAFEVRGVVRMASYPLEFVVQSSLSLETSRMQVTDMRTA